MYEVDCHCFSVFVISDVENAPVTLKSLTQNCALFHSCDVLSYCPLFSTDEIGYTVVLFLVAAFTRMVTTC